LAALPQDGTRAASGADRARKRAKGLIKRLQRENTMRRTESTQSCFKYKLKGGRKEAANMKKDTNGRCNAHIRTIDTVGWRKRVSDQKKHSDRQDVPRNGTEQGKKKIILLKHSETRRRG